MENSFLEREGIVVENLCDNSYLVELDDGILIECSIINKKNNVSIKDRVLVKLVSLKSGNGIIVKKVVDKKLGKILKKVLII